VAENRQIDLLKKMLSLSMEQETAVKEGRLASALELMKRREALADEMKRAGVIIGERDVEARGLLSEIAESDRRVRIFTEERLKAVSEKLEARLKAKNVISAYMGSEQG
jgi:hypothetical protein